MNATDHVVVFDEDRDRASRIAGLLAPIQDGVNSRSVRTFHDLPGAFELAPGIQELRSGLPKLAIVVESQGSRSVFSGVRELARQQGIATLLIVQPWDDPALLADRVRGWDSWIAIEAIERELAARVIETLERAQRSNQNRFPAVDPRFLALVVHDLRTPLNVIGLTIRAITQTIPDRSADLDEDLLFLTENAAQIEKMLAQLGDYSRLNEGETRVSAAEFDPRRFLEDFVEVSQMKQKGTVSPVRLELTETMPVEVSLDQNLAVLALQHALANAINASGKSPIRLRSSGSTDRWILEVIVDKPPPKIVVSNDLRPDLFERLVGSAAERRGLDLAIVARVSELLGGKARLAVEPDQRSIIVLDWPQRFAD